MSLTGAAYLEDGEGTRLVENEPCSCCGHRTRERAFFCPKCGTRLVKDSDSSSEDMEGERQPASRLLTALVVLGVASVAAGLATMGLNWAAKDALEVVGTSVLGVNTSVGGVSLALFRLRSEISNVGVATVPGYGVDHFLDVAEAVFDLRILSLLWSPIELQEFTAHNLRVNIDQTTAGSNAKWIVDHVTKVTQGGGTGGANGDQVATPTVSDDIHAVTGKIVADRVAIHNITVRICVHPMCELAPTDFVLEKVLVQDVGKGQGGVYVYEFIEIFVQAVLRAVVQAAPSQLGFNLRAMMSGGLTKVLDYASLHLDRGQGFGLEQVVGGWASAQADLLGNATALAGDRLGEAVGQRTSAAETAVENMLGDGDGQTGDVMREAVANSTGGTGLGQAAEQAIDNVSSMLGSDIHSLGDRFGSMLSGLKEMEANVVSQGNNTAAA